MYDHEINQMAHDLASALVDGDNQKRVTSLTLSFAPKGIVQANATVKVRRTLEPNVAMNSYPALKAR